MHKVTNITCQPSPGSFEPSSDVDSVLLDPSTLGDDTDVDSLTKTDFTVVVDGSGDSVVVVVVVVVVYGGTI